MAATVAGLTSAYGTHRSWERTERTTAGNGWVLGAYAPAALGALAIGASLLARGPARVLLRSAAAGGMLGALAGWGSYVATTGRDVWAIPFDPEMRLAKDLRTRRAERSPGEGARGPDRDRDPGSFTFAVVGDYGSGTSAQEQVARNIAEREPRFILTVGDNVQTKGTEAEFRGKWDPPELFGDLRARFPVYPTLGNHDVMGRQAPDAYFERFPELDGRHWYSFHRDGISFFALDSNQSLRPGSEQRRWLERELAQAQEGWKVLYMHHPIVEPGDREPGEVRIRHELGPLLARHGVDLVLVGHQHAYERSRPLNGHGTLHVATGSGGDTTREFGDELGAGTAYRRAAMGHVEIEVRDDELVGRYRLRDGTVDDTWSVRRPSAGTRITDGGDTARAAPA